MQAQVNTHGLTPAHCEHKCKHCKTQKAHTSVQTTKLPQALQQLSEKEKMYNYLIIYKNN